MPDIVRFCLASAMRISEVCRLEWKDFDAKAKTVINPATAQHPQDKLGNDQSVRFSCDRSRRFSRIAQRQPRKGPAHFPSQ